MNSLAPIAIFVYNRITHTKQTIQALQSNYLAKDSELFIFSDGPKDKLLNEKILELRSYLTTIDGFKKISIIKREENFGLAKSIITGVTQVVNDYGKVIVIEDDLVTSPYFLEYMNEGLNKYQDDERVISIHGYVYPIKHKLPETFFIKGADCWGWATWKRGWDLFENDGQKLLDELRLKKLTKKFDFDETYPYTKMLEDQISKKNNSWAIRWYASAFLKDKLTLYPGKSLVKNIGFDNSGTHCGFSDDFVAEIFMSRISINPIDIKENIKAKKLFKDFLKPKRKNIFSKFFKLISDLLKNIYYENK
jgi:hypothetical protein